MKMARTMTYGKLIGKTVVMVTTNSTFEREMLQKSDWMNVPEKYRAEMTAQIVAEGFKVAEPVTFAQHFGKSL